MMFYVFECTLIRIHMYPLETEHTRRRAIATPSLQNHLRHVVISKKKSPGERQREGERERERKKMMHKKVQGSTRNVIHQA